MASLSVTLDPSDVAYKTLQKEIHEYLISLETVKFTTEARPAPAGTLTGEADVFKYVIENATAIINLVAAIMLIVAQVHASSEKDGKKKGKEKASKPVVIEVNEKRISLPASEQTRRKFLKIVENDLRGTARPQSQRETPKPETRAKQLRSNTKKTSRK